MILSDSPDARRELDRLLDADDPELLEADRNCTSGTLTDLARILNRSINAMSAAEKKSVRHALESKMPNPKKFDQKFLRDDGIKSEPEDEGEIDENEDRDCVLAYMKAHGIELTRENYLALAYLGDDLELDAECESMLPKRFQKWD